VRGSTSGRTDSKNIAAERAVHLVYKPGPTI